MTEQKKMIEERIEMAIGKAYGYPDVANLEVNTDLARAIRQEIALLISDVVKEIVGEDVRQTNIVLLTYPPQYPKTNSKEYCDGWNDRGEKIRQRAKKLGIEI